MISSQLQHDLHIFIEYTKTIKIIKNKNYFYIFFFICRSQTTGSPSFNIYRKKPSPSFGYSGRWLFVLFLYSFFLYSFFLYSFYFLNFSLLRKCIGKFCKILQSQCFSSNSRFKSTFFNSLLDFLFGIRQFR